MFLKAQAVSYTLKGRVELGLQKLKDNLRGKPKKSAALLGPKERWFFAILWWLQAHSKPLYRFSSVSIANTEDLFASLSES